jgi:methionyl-tRNA formyltransferase
MSVYLDAGDILAQEALDIGPEETAGELEVRLAPLGARLALQVIDQIAAGTAHRVKQDKSQATKAPKLTKEHGQIDWSRPAAAVCNQIRAMQPWPTAYTFRHRPGQEPARLLIYKAAVSEGKGGGETTPGTVILQPGEASRLIVAAGQGTEVEILELQPAGKRRMSATEYLRGRPLQPGDRFGPETA